LCNLTLIDNNFLNLKPERNNMQRAKLKRKNDLVENNAFIEHLVRHFILIYNELWEEENCSFLYSLLFYKKFSLSQVCPVVFFSDSFRFIFVQSNKRKPAAGYFKLHRLLYFIRAVGIPASDRQPQGRSGK